MLHCLVNVAFHARQALPRHFLRFLGTPRPLRSRPAVFSPRATHHSPLPLNPILGASPAAHLKGPRAFAYSPSFSASPTGHGTQSTEHVFPLSPFPATHTKNAPVSPLLATHTKTKDLKSFSCHTYEKTPGGGSRFPSLIRSLTAFTPAGSERPICSFFRLCLYLVTSSLQSSGANHASPPYRAVRITIVVP